MKSKKQQNQIIMFQEDCKMNKPNMLIKNVIHNKSLETKDKKVYNVILRQFLHQNLENYQTNTIRTSISQISRELNTTKREDIFPILNKLQGTIITYISDGIKWDSPLIAEKGLELKNQDTLFISFAPRLTTELLKNLDTWAKLDLIEMNNLSKKASLALYECFKAYLAKHHYQNKNFYISELKDITGHKDTKMTNGEYKRSVIDPAIKEINATTGISIEIIEKPNTRNEKKELLYKFKVMTTGTLEMSSGLFKAMMVELVKKDYKIKQIYKGKTYTLAPQEAWSDTSASKQERMDTIDKILWLNEQGATVRQDTADTLWTELHNYYLGSSPLFFENLELDPSDWVKLEKELKSKLK